MQSSQVALIQDSFFLGDKEKNYKLMEERVHECSRKYPQAELLVFPEMSATGYFLDATILEQGESREGETFEKVSSLAKRKNVYIIYGFPETAEPGENRLYNSINVVTPLGERAATYRKVHVTALEKAYFKPGSNIQTVETELGTLGLMICWDLAFPEMARLLQKKGSHLLVAPSAWEMPYQYAFKQFAAARAIDQSLFVAAVNHTGQSEVLDFFGESVFFLPDGQLASQGPFKQTDIVTGHVNRAFQRKCKSEFFCMDIERRTDLYDVMAVK
ncbi:carbon-nitrogen hydrolase family protein [Thalassorhabdus alkalitolerans]|uniref:Carbon-nitrogen hydrolase family protein n=1 Tax=Thalassorhabdus alkalitolerans TaxID=2282697 RepID=A0ABW0YFY3_9BACI